MFSRADKETYSLVFEGLFKHSLQNGTRRGKERNCFAEGDNIWVY